MSALKKRKPVVSLEVDTINYYKRVEETLKEGFPTDEEKELFLDNVFQQLEEEAVPVCQCHLTSHVIEDLVSIATVNNLRSLLTVFSQNWIGVCEDKCASHVLQAALITVPKYIRNIAPNATIEDLNEASSEKPEMYVICAVLELSRALQEDLNQSISHMYTSHILRAVLQVLGGTYVGETLMKSRTSRKNDKEYGSKSKEGCQFSDFGVSKVFHKRLKKISKDIFKLENFNLWLMDKNANPVIQTLLMVLKKVDLDLCQKYIHKVIQRSRIKDVQDGNENTDAVRLPPVAVDSVGSFLVGQIVSLATEDLYQELFTALFKGRLLQFAISPTANFVLQKLIRSCPGKSLFEELFEELGNHVEDTLAFNHFGVIVALAETCRRLNCCQDKFLQKLMSAFHCWEPLERQVKLVPLLASFRTYDMSYDDKNQCKAEKEISQVNYHGSVLLQNLLQFRNTKLLTTSLLALEPLTLKTLSCDPAGSHVIDVLFQSGSVGEKQKEQILHKFTGWFVELACDRCGSRALEAIWKSLGIKLKTMVAEQLSKQQDKVHSDRFGRHIYNNFALRLFTTRRKDWAGVQGQEKKKRELFQELLTPEKGSKKQKKTHVNKA